MRNKARTLRQVSLCSTKGHNPKNTTQRYTHNKEDVKRDNCGTRSDQQTPARPARWARRETVRPVSAMTPRATRPKAGDLECGQ